MKLAGRRQFIVNVIDDSYGRCGRLVVMGIIRDGSLKNRHLHIATREGLQLIDPILEFMGDILRKVCKRCIFFRPLPMLGPCGQRETKTFS